MPLVTTTEMFQSAYEGGYAIGAFNVNNMEIVQGITEAAKEVSSPLILQVSAGARKYAKHGYLMKLVEAAVEDTGLPIALHLDHGEDFAICKACIDGGFTSVMIDGSKHSFADNIALTRQVVEYAHQHGVVVEGELGRLAGIEDDVNVVNVGGGLLLYRPQPGGGVCRATGWTAWPLPSAPATAPISLSRGPSPNSVLISWRRFPAACLGSPLYSTGPRRWFPTMWSSSTPTAAS